MIALRRILFYLFALVYIVVCPVLILYALGIIFKPGSTTIQKTGIISLSTFPPDATIYMNNKLYPERTPAVIRNLIPGDYDIKITLPDHLTWSNLLRVEGEKATAAENILLIPKEWSSRRILLNPFENFLSIPKEPFLLLNQGPYLKDLFILRFDKIDKDVDRNPLSESPFKENPKVIQPLVEIDDPLGKSKILKYEIISESPFVFIQAALLGKLKYFWVNLKTNHDNIVDVTDLFPEPPDMIRWDTSDNRSLFTLTNGIVNRIDIRAKAIYPGVLKNILSFTPFDNQLYFLAQDLSLKRANLEGTDSQNLFENTSIQTFLSRDETFQLQALKKDLVIFLSENGLLLFNHPPYELVPHDVKGFVFNASDNDLLVWTRNKIGVIDLSERENKVSRTSQTAAITWLPIEGENIRQAFWVNNGYQILWRDNNTVFICDANNTKNLPANTITSVKKGTTIHYDEQTGRLFYLDPRDHYLVSIDILSSKFLLHLPLPKDKFKDLTEPLRP